MPDNFENMPARQKVSAVIFLLIIIVILWQVIGLFRGKKETTDITPTSPTATTTMPKSAPPANISKGTTVPVTSAPPATAPTAALSEPAPVIAPPPTPLLMQQEQSQNKYISALNELQILKIQREIAETSQAIVAAKLATVTAEKDISEVLAPPPAPKSSMATLAAPSATPSSINVAPEAVSASSYTVQSVTMELDQWHAVMGYRGKLYNLSVGDVFPPDGSTVTAIDQQGVTLELGGTQHKVPLSSTDLSPPSKSQEGSSSGTPPGT